MQWVFRLLKRSEITPDLKNKEVRCAPLGCLHSACWQIDACAQVQPAAALTVSCGAGAHLVAGQRHLVLCICVQGAPSPCLLAVPALASHQQARLHMLHPARSSRKRCLLRALGTSRCAAHQPAQPRAASGWSASPFSLCSKADTEEHRPMAPRALRTQRLGVRR